MLLQDLVQFLPLFVIEVEVLALRDGLGAHQLGDGRPVAAILEKSCTQNRQEFRNGGETRTRLHHCYLWLPGLTPLSNTGRRSLGNGRIVSDSEESV